MVNRLTPKDRHNLFVSICASQHTPNFCISKNIPRGDLINISWNLKSNPGDGHCFYHGILRGLRDLGLEDDLVNLLSNGQIKYIDQSREAVVRFRERLLEYVRQENSQALAELQENINSAIDVSVSTYDLDKMIAAFETRESTFMEEETRMEIGLAAAKKGDVVGGACYASEKEVEAVTRLFNICVAIWSDEGVVGPYWIVSGPRKGSGFVLAPTKNFPELIEGGFTDLANPEECPNVIFLDNSGGRHFNTLEPRIGESKELESKEPEPKKKVDNRSCMYRYDKEIRRKGPMGDTCKTLRNGGKNFKEEWNRLGCCLEEPWLSDCAWIPHEGCTSRTS